MGSSEHYKSLGSTLRLSILDFGFVLRQKLYWITWWLLINFSKLTFWLLIAFWLLFVFGLMVTSWLVILCHRLLDTGEYGLHKGVRPSNFYYHGTAPVSLPSRQSSLCSVFNIEWQDPIIIIDHLREKKLANLIEHHNPPLKIFNLSKFYKNSTPRTIIKICKLLSNWTSLSPQHKM